MKTITFIRNTAATLAGILIFTSFSAFTQVPGNFEGWLKSSLSNIPPVKDKPVRYRMTADYFAKSIEGQFLNKNRVVGTVTYKFPSTEVQWNDCSMSTAMSEKDAFPTPEKFDYMENFTFVPGFQMSEAAGFPGWPENSYHAKNLVWDMMAFDAFGVVFLDSLELGKAFSPALLNGVVGLAGQGSFENRNSTIRWVGVTQYQGVDCALIEYRQMDGNLQMETPLMKIKGRSHYWGLIWISLHSKLIEYAEMTESVNIWIDMPGVMQPMWSDNLREIKVEKL